MMSDKDIEEYHKVCLDESLLYNKIDSNKYNYIDKVNKITRNMDHGPMM